MGLLKLAFLQDPLGNDARIPCQMATSRCSNKQRTPKTTMWCNDPLSQGLHRLARLSQQIGHLCTVQEVGATSADSWENQARNTENHTN